jgi:hypothetical protein
MDLDAPKTETPAVEVQIQQLQPEPALPTPPPVGPPESSPRSILAAIGGFFVFFTTFGTLEYSLDLLQILNI